jgi:dTDP-4-dehydrorhamnose reductase
LKARQKARAIFNCVKIMLIGAGGQLAQDILLRAERDEIVPLTHQELDIRDEPRVSELVARIKPSCIINTAAFHRVDVCEDEPENAFDVNEGGVRKVARAAERAKALLVQFSTDYVFDGAKRTPYFESDQPNPQSVYAQSRLAGERAVEQNCSNYIIARTCGLYGKAGMRTKAGAGNFVETMLRLGREKKSLKVVEDQVCTPTSTKDLTQHILELIYSDARGLFHLTNTGECSWYSFAREIFRLAGVDADLRATSTQEYGAKAKRPAYSVLDNLAFRNAGFKDFRHWQEALADYLRED